MTRRPILPLGRRSMLAGAAALLLPQTLLPGTALAQRGIVPAGQSSLPPPPGTRKSPPQTAVLMPGTPMHVGPIRTVAVSSDGTIIATGSADRTIRIWSAATGEGLLRLSLPLGEGSVGVVDALALSGDNTKLFAAGQDWAAPAGSSQGMIYVFDLATGKMNGLMAWPAGFGSRLRDLSVSPAGNVLAIAAGPNGLIVRETAGPAFALKFSEPPNLASVTSAVAFSPDGKTLAAASGGGRLRLFAVNDDGTIKETSVRTLTGGGEANSVAFSPDGERLAIGYLDRPMVHVTATRPGGAVTVLEGPGRTSRGNLGAVAWTKAEDKSTWLFAGGTVVDPAGANLLVAWRDGKPGAPFALPVAQDSITDVIAHPGAGVIFGSSDPRWGWITPTPDARAIRPVRMMDTERLDFRGLPARLWGIDPGGTMVEFQGTTRTATPLRFDLRELTLGSAVPRRPDLLHPKPVTGAVPGLALPKGAIPRAIDTGPAGTLVGTDDYLLLFDSAGREAARIQVATAAWAVAQARNARIAVAAHGDGTLRWYSLDRARMLEELGGLFVASDEQRWVAWRADGRFAHSAGGGAKLVGFQQNGQFEPGHVAEGALTGRWLDIDQLYRRLYDPDQVRQMLAADDSTTGAPKDIEQIQLPTIGLQRLCPAEDVSAQARGIRVLGDAPAEEAVALPAQKAEGGVCRALDTGGLRPEETITLPPGTSAMRVQLSLDGHGNPLQIAAFVNEQNVGRTVVRPQASRSAGALSVEQLVPLFPGQNRVEFRAYVPGKQDFTRAPTILRVEIPRAAGTAPATDKPVLRGLVVGIDTYHGTIHPLRYARADAETFAAAIGRRVAREYAEPEVKTLLDEAATLDSVTKALADIAAESRPQDAVVIYFSGHGVVGSEDKSYAYMTADVTDANAALRGGQGMGADRLARSLAEVRAERIFIFLDTCYAGAFDPRTIGYLNHDTGRYVLAASTRLEEALDGFDGKNGLFAYAVKEALDGKVGQPGRSVDAFDLGRYVTGRVEELAQTKSWQQRAVFQAAGRITAFPLVAPA